MRSLLILGIVLIQSTSSALGETPTLNYIFPAGGQRGKTVVARVGGCNLYRSPKLFWVGQGVSVPAELTATEKIWFEGPVIPQPASQQKEDYPRDFLANISIKADAPVGRQTWRLGTSQGVTTAWGFIVGSFPEVIEQEIDGDSPAVSVALPVTINGRIFPREDVDTWSFTEQAGRIVTCLVSTSEFGSPLEARIEVRGPGDEVIGEQLPQGALTPPLRFKTPADGNYQIRIHDVGFGGLQDHVYRLTLTSGPVLDCVYPLGGRKGTSTTFEVKGANLSRDTIDVMLPVEASAYAVRWPEEESVGSVPIDLDDLTENLESEPDQGAPQSFSVPANLNGRIRFAGDQDTWVFAARKEVEYDIEVRAARLGSPLDAVLEIADSQGKRLAEADDSPGLQTDARLRWTAPADGDYRISIRDRLASRGDDRYAYRIRVISTEQPEFLVTSATEVLNLDRNKSGTMKFLVDRGPSFREAVELTLQGLPEGVTITTPGPYLIPATQREFQLTLKSDADARVNISPVKVYGRARCGDRERLVPVRFQPANPEPGRIVIADDTGQCWIAVSVPTPFKFHGIFETKFISRGAVFVRQYRIERNGFEGPLEVHLADRQGRHLQGVTAETVQVPAGCNEFEFAVKLAPWMEIGRTCRSTLALTGMVADPDGATHVVSYSSNDQNNQMIALVDPGRFAVTLSRSTLKALPGQRVSIPFKLQRAPSLQGPAIVEIIAPEAMQGVSAEKMQLADQRSEGQLELVFKEQLHGLEIRPLTIRATTLDERSLPVTSEAYLTLVQ